MEKNLMIFKRVKDIKRVEHVVMDSSDNLTHLDIFGNIFTSAKAPHQIDGKSLCHASKQDIFSCLTDEEIDAEYRRRLIGKDVLFADIPVGSYVEAEGEKCKVILSGEAVYKDKAIEIHGVISRYPLSSTAIVCEPPEPKKNEELSDLIKSMEEMISIAKKHMECEE